MTAIIASLALCFISGCTRRELTIIAETTDRTPIDGAEVHINQSFAGKTPLAVGFDDYGDYAIEIRANGYQTVKVVRHIGTTWYGWEPLRLIVDLMPFTVVDRREYRFNIPKRSAPDAMDKLRIERLAMNELRRVRARLDAVAAPVDAAKPSAKPVPADATGCKIVSTER